MRAWRAIASVVWLTGCPLVTAFLSPKGDEGATCHTTREYRVGGVTDGGCLAACPDHTEFNAGVEGCYRVEEADPDAGTLALWRCTYLLRDCSQGGFDAGYPP